MPYQFDNNDNMICRKCGKSMTINFAWEQDEERPHYSDEDEWVCSCGFSMPCRRYADWFGSGDLHEEVADYLENFDEQPIKILYSGFMACIVWENEVVVFGYDGNEYTHSFLFSNEEPFIQPALTQMMGLGLGDLVSMEEVDTK
jgi:hypothetical protein